MANFYRLFKELVPEPPLLVGTVESVVAGGCYVDLPGGGGRVFARGVSTVSKRVFVRDGVIEGEAPQLPVIEITV